MFQTHFVNKYGIAEFCDVRPSNLQSDKLSEDQGDYTEIRDGDLVYVTSSALPWWIVNIYPRIYAEKTRIFLVTGDATVSCPNGVLGNHELVDILLGHGTILHWFTQNIDVIDHPMVTPIPLGIDFHTICQREKWGEAKSSPQVQEKKLLDISEYRPSQWRAKEPLVFMDAHLTSAANQEDRLAAFSSLNASGVGFFSLAALSREDYWKTMSRFKFVISPLGVGMDCHRTWEALSLGIVPIIRRTTLSPLFSGLPVIEVESYNEVDKLLLESFDYDRSWNREKLTLSFWQKRISEVMNKALNTANL